MRTYLCGVPFDPVTKEDALRLAEDALAGEEETLTVVTPNAVIAGKCLADPRLAVLLSRASLCLADGAGAVLASRFAAKKAPEPGPRCSGTASSVHRPFPERVAGIDFGYGVLEIAARTGDGVYLVGGKPGVADTAASRLCRALPGLRVVGTSHGYFPSASREQLLARIRSSQAKILFVCLGFPKQEQFILEAAEKLPSVRVAAGLGGSLDVWAGRLRRAPRWVRSLRAEWLWRTLREPKRVRELGFGVRFLVRSAFPGAKKDVFPQQSGGILHSFPKSTSEK